MLVIRAVERRWWRVASDDDFVEQVSGLMELQALDAK